MSAFPSHKYTLSAVESREFALNWFKKLYPDLPMVTEDDFEDAAFGVFDIVKNFIGTESSDLKKGPGYGGSHGEVRCAVAAAMGIAIVFDDDEVRHFNTDTIIALKKHWQDNDHEGFLARCAGYERNATNAKIDLLPVAKEVEEGVWEMLDDEEEDQNKEIDPVVSDFAETLGETTDVKRFITGNRHRRKLSKKPPMRQQKMLDLWGTGR